MILHLQPDTAILSLTAGLALIAVELNRPGLILPGALGLLVTLLAAARLLQLRPHPASLVLVLAAAIVLLSQLRLDLPLWAPVVAMLAAIAGLVWLFPASSNAPLHPATALFCGIALGAGTTVLTRIARRARRNKGLD